MENERDTRMYDTLKNFLLSSNFSTERGEFDEDWTRWNYREDLNVDKSTGKSLENEKGYIYKVGVLVASDLNKCDWAYAAIGFQRGKKYTPEVKGALYFRDGENDNMPKVIERAFKLMQPEDDYFPFI